MECQNYVVETRTGIHETAKIYTGIHFRPDLKLNMEQKTFIGSNCTILVPELTMKEGSQICAGTVLAGKDPVVLEKNAVVGYNCTLLTASDTPKGEFMNDASPETKRHIKRGKIILKENSFVSSGAVIAPGVTVGERSFVGPNAVLISSLDDNKMYAIHKELMITGDRDEFGKIHREKEI